MVWKLTDWTMFCPQKIWHGTCCLYRMFPACPPRLFPSPKAIFNLNQLPLFAAFICSCSPFTLFVCLFYQKEIHVDLKMNWNQSGLITRNKINLDHCIHSVVSDYWTNSSLLVDPRLKYRPLPLGSTLIVCTVYGPLWREMIKMPIFLLEKRRLNRLR